ncbi:MAG: HEAT repeat domain-containing protein [Candidatus Anstonellales archaeon]
MEGGKMEVNKKWQGKTRIAKAKTLMKTLMIAPLLSLSLQCSGIFLRDTTMNVKGSVSPIFGITWDATFIGHFDEKRRQEVKKDLADGRFRGEDAREAERVTRADIHVEGDALLNDLIRGLDSKDRETVIECIFLLGNFSYSARHKNQKMEAINKIYKILVSSGNYKIRAHALLALTKMRYAVIEEAKIMLFDSNALIRFVSAHHLSELGNESCLDALKKALSQETQPTVRNEIEKAIKNIERNYKK